ncbi:YihY/virulence factor BrkB family protein [Sphingomonas sp. LHG3406-1]|uniref:YihY/virulence factor BrkB family protein n=1 Tax=Sphingomonas sp. LHG3406-1 TaxID=2804617 RepID=UPI002636CDF9|nr:YihY/virulence factor BrkB family protein [Sphingomonas sp. LHG3406-1]
MKEISPHSPEARRKRLAKLKARFGEQVVDRVKPGTRPFEIMKRVAVGVYNDGFIHAGNLAYLSLLSMFPFFILAAAVAQLLGSTDGAQATVYNVLASVPPDIAAVLREPVTEVLTARQGPLLWFGALVGLWTASSFIETIRDILRRAYGVTYTAPFWEYRLISIVFMLGLVLMLMIALAMTVALSSIEALVLHLVPQFEQVANSLTLLKAVPTVMLYLTVYLVFLVLTPSRYRKMRCRKWPGALLVTAWWIGTAVLLPKAIGLAGGYSLTYGSLAGVMITLLFFFIVGLGVVMGAELNAALAETGPVALEGEQFKGPHADELEVEAPGPGEDIGQASGESRAA